ncbi:hypothetical protein AOQ84DRAFT_388345 [Glonium stellatum]|uniref:Uncharacterized protein n=1 Tax=Glonium stellatum TaxID=574774 RepID=A0A8E2F3E4_9PEZI|nr:hypothetical protein AOQ84DRAFT_388345 [Glonium stellatum]
MAKRKPTANERQARAAANGYQRGAYQENDSIHDENKYVDITEELQDWTLVLYKEWMAEDGDGEGECLARGAQAPDLATLKDFIRFYISALRG